MFILLLAGFINSVHARSTVWPGTDPGDSTSVVIPTTEQMLQEIIDVTGLTPDFELKAADVLNLEASVSHRKRYILYNPTYINWLNRLTGDKWAAMTLLAHEVGHHFNGHTMGRKGNRLDFELEADEFAGFILNKLGATLQQAQQVMRYVARKVDSDTHPAQASRLLAIEKGWNKAGADNLSSASSAKE